MEIFLPFGYNQSAQFLGAFGGSVLGGSLAAMFGIQSVFLVTGVLLLANAVWVYKMVCAQPVNSA